MYINLYRNPILQYAYFDVVLAFLFQCKYDANEMHIVLPTLHVSFPYYLELFENYERVFSKCIIIAAKKNLCLIQIPLRFLTQSK